MVLTMAFYDLERAFNDEDIALGRWRRSSLNAGRVASNKDLQLYDYRKAIADESLSTQDWSVDQLLGTA